MDSFKEFLNESSLSRVQQHVQNRNFGILSAYRHRPELSTAENTKLNIANTTSLKKDLKASGFGHIKMTGRYVENYGKPNATPVEEESFMVVGNKDDHKKLLGFLKEHGAKYNQDSILFKKHDELTANLHGTNETGYPGKDETANVGVWHPSRAGEFHTLMKNGRTFEFSRKPDVFTNFNLLEDVCTYLRFSYDETGGFFSRHPRSDVEF